MAVPLRQRVEAATTNLTVTTLARLCDGFEVDPRELLSPVERLPPRRPGRPTQARKPARGKPIATRRA